MQTKSFGRYTRKQKRNRRIKKVMSWIGYGLVLFAGGVMYGITFLMLFYNYLPK